MLRTILFLCLMAFGTAQAALVTSDLIHRWTFTDNSPTIFLDSVGGAGLYARGTVHNVYSETSGAVPGIKLGNAAGTDSLGYLICDAADLDMTGRQKFTVEAIFSCKNLAGPTVYANLVGICADSSSQTSSGLQLYNYRALNQRFYMRLRDSNSSSITQVADVSSANFAGSLQKAVFVNDSIGGTSAVYWLGLDDATLSIADTLDTYTGEIDELDGYNLLIGDPRISTGELHLVELRIYGAALNATQLNTNHTQDILQYGTTTPIDVWVDSSVSAEGYGTITSPYKTLEAAWKRITRGSTIRFKKAGTYAGGQFTLTDASSYPSSWNGINLLGLSTDTDGVVIEAGATTADYPLRLGDGTWNLRYLKFDADSTTGYCVYADSVTVDALNLDVCTITNTLSGTSTGTGILSRAQKTVIDSCSFSDIEEHCIYLRNKDAAADYDASAVTHNTFTDWNNYLVQVSSSGDSAYTFTNLDISFNTASSPKAAGAGGFYIAGTDTVSIMHNTLDFSSVTSTGFAVTFGSDTIRNAFDGLIANNEVTGAFLGISGGFSAAPYKSYGMKIHNNYFVDCTTDFDPDSAVTYEIGHCRSFGSTTSFYDSFADSAGITEGEITPAVRSWGGESVTGLTGSSAGFYPLGVLTYTASLATPSDPVISAAQSGAGFRTPVEALEFVRDNDLGSGYTLDLVLGGGSYTAPSQANLDIWLHVDHPLAADSTDRKWSYADFCKDTLKIGRVK